MKNKRFLLSMAVSIFVLLLVVLLSLLLGDLRLSFGDLADALFGKREGISFNILMYSRLPRTLASLLAGAALALSGAVLQNVLANKLASPSIIGVNAGAGLGVTLSCALGVFSGWAVSAFAFGGSLLAVLIISLFAAKTSASKTTVILGGVALNSILNALSESLSVLDPDVAMLSAEFRVGGFSSVSYQRLFPAMIMILLAALLLFTLCNELDVISLGDESARSVGLSTKKYRILFLLLASLLAGAAVSFSGLLGFVGLIVPHFARRLVGNESRFLLPFSAVTGAAFVSACELVSRLLFSPYELPVGILMSMIGGPVFVILLVKMKGGRRHA